MRSLFAIAVPLIASLACLGGAPDAPGSPGPMAASPTEGAVAPAPRRPARPARTGGIVHRSPGPMGSRVVPSLPHTGQDGAADLEPALAPRAVPGTSGVADTTEVLLDRTVLEADLATVQSVNEVIGLRPHVTLRGIDGFKVTSLPEGSPLVGIGLQEGDIIHRVNGRELDSVQAAWEAGSALQDASRVEGEITRDGQARRLVVHLD